jgi:20S proteasome alpha/beta subunit
MTICMGALCQQKQPGDTIVLAADRMVTWMGLTEFEHRVPKAHEVSATSVVLVAGDVLTGARIARATKVALAGQATPPASMDVIADLAAQCYAGLRQEIAQAQFFAPRGLSIAQYYQAQQQLVSGLVTMLDSALANFDLGVELIVAGMDSLGGHLHTVGNPGGWQQCHDPIGTIAVGSGAIHAIQSMIGYRHSAAEPVKETVYRVFSSKRRAELAPGVGHDTDLMILNGNGVVHIPDDTLAALDVISDEATAAQDKDLLEQVSNLTLDLPAAGADHE